MVPVEEEMFVSAMQVLEKLSSNHGDHHEAETFYFNVFAEGKESIDRQGRMWLHSLTTSIYGHHLVGAVNNSLWIHMHHLLSSNCIAFHFITQGSYNPWLLYVPSHVLLPYMDISCLVSLFNDCRHHVFVLSETYVAYLP